MKKIISLFLASLLLVGCSNASNLDPTPTATPEPTVEPTPEVVKNITEGYMQVERDGECYWDENRNFIHGHELSFEEFLKDFTFTNMSMTEKFCKIAETNKNAYDYYKKNNGEVLNGEGPYQKFGYFTMKMTPKNSLRELIMRVESLLMK